MARLIAFGCSLTYGHCLEEKQTEASNLSWPSILATELDRSCINISSPGASNKRIWNDLIHFEFEPNDLVVAFWTYPYRSALIKKDEIFDLNLTEQNSKNRYVNHFKMTYDEHDSNLMNRLFVSHANLFLNSKHIPIHNLVWSKEFDFLLELDSRVDSIPVYFSDVYFNLPRALDQSHPGIEAHYQFGKRLAKQLLTFGK